MFIQFWGHKSDMALEHVCLTPNYILSYTVCLRLPGGSLGQHNDASLVPCDHFLKIASGG